MKWLFPMMVMVVLIGRISIATAQTTTSSSASYSFTDRGGMTVTTVGGSSSVVVGYGRIQPGGGTTLPAGVAIFGYRSGGVLVTEAGVPAMQPVLSGRIYAEMNGPINTGVAFANPNPNPVTVSFYFTNANGNNTAANNFTIGAGAQIARFLNEFPFNMNNFVGTFTFTASAPLGVISLRGVTNSRSEFLITTQTIAPLTTASSSPLVMAHFADGGGWTTHVVLVNSTDQLIAGTVQFFGEGSASVAGTPVTLAVNGQAGVSFNYAIPARAAVKLETSGIGTATQVGSVRVTPASGSNSPSGFTIFSLTQNGTLTTQASIAGEAPSSAFRLYVETSGTAGATGSIQSGLAMTNTSSAAATVTVELYTMTGVYTGFTETLTIPGTGHIAKFVHEIFPALPLPFSGILRIRANQSPITVVGLRTRYNERAEFLITTTPASNEASASLASDAIFPHIVVMGGYTTQFVLFSGSQSQPGLGILNFYSQVGQSMNVTYQ
jgi:hypothetical protein